MKRLSNAYLTLIRASSPRPHETHAQGPGSELSLSLYTSMVIYRLVCAIERGLVQPWRRRRQRTTLAA